MGGVLTHLTVALIGAGLVYWHYHKILYASGFFIGQIIPDAIKFGITGLRYGTISFERIVTYPLFWTLEGIFGSLLNWFILFVVVVGIMFTLLKLKKIQYVHFIKTFYFMFYLTVGVYIHLVIDMLYEEPSYWL
jgi:hypothetical protein